MTDSALPVQLLAVPPAMTIPDALDFRALYQKESGFIWNTLRYLGVARSDVDDVCAEAFIVVHRHLAAYDTSRSIRPWLFGIAVRVAADYRKSTRRSRLVLADSIEMQDDRPDPEQALESAQRINLVHKALDTLDPDRRAIFVAIEIDGLSMPETIASLGIPLNTGYSRLRLAREEFAAAIHRSRAQRREP